MAVLTWHRRNKTRHKEGITMAFNTESNSNMLPRAEAEKFCNDLARGKGIKGSYKVFYNGTIVDSPASLPDTFDKTLIKVSATLDQA